MSKFPITRETLAQVAPKLAALSEEVLFGDIWQRSELSPRQKFDHGECISGAVPH
jgi:4-carboxymuconolactone decarboxylase